MSVEDFLADIDVFSSSFSQLDADQRERPAPTLQTENLRSQKRERDGDGNTWSCHACTLINAIASKKCGACGTRRQKTKTRVEAAVPPVQPQQTLPVAAAASSAQTWQCPVCTCSNDLRAQACSACGLDAQSGGKVCPCGTVVEAAAAECPRCRRGASTFAVTRGVENAVIILEGDETQDFNDESDSFSDSDFSDSDCDDDYQGAGNVAMVEHILDRDRDVSEMPEAACPPSMIGAALKRHQLQALHWMAQREREGLRSTFPCPGGILADYMGLGKTRTLIALCEATRRQRVDQMIADRLYSTATLILCPMSVMHQWRREIMATCRPQPRVLIYHGSNRRLGIFGVAQEYDYVITSYHTAMYDFTRDPAKKLYRIHWHRLILDEAHYIRNSSTVLFKSASHLTCNKRWAVTATPIQNRLRDLQALLSFLQLPRELQVFGTDSQMLEALLATVLLRRLPTTLLDGKMLLNLPEKHDEVVSFPLEDAEMKFLAALQKRAKERMKEASKKSTLNAYATAFEMLMRCRQACLHSNIVIASLRAKHPDAEGEKSKSDLNAQKDLEAFIKKLEKKLSCTGNFKQAVCQSVLDGSLLEQECTICLDNFKDPTFLTCGHIFCKGCIDNFLSNMRRCPFCKATVHTKQLVQMPTGVQESKQPVGDEALSKWLERDPGPVPQWPESSRVRRIADIIGQVGAGERVLVLSSFVAFLRVLGHALERQGVTFSVLEGSMSSNRRSETIKAFSKEEGGPKVLLASMGTCGVGLNLTRASVCILAEPTWNPGIEEQAVNRVYRMGQERNVRIIRFVSAGTVEEKMQALCKEKQKLGEVLSSSAKLSQSDIAAIVMGAFE